MAFEMALRRMGKDNVTPHGFRSSFRDWAEECTRYKPSWIESALAHKVQNKVEASYQRSTFFQQRIQMELAVKQDTVGEIFQTSRGGSVPSIDTRELQTTVLVANGDTVVLGGIFQDEKSSREEKVPWLGDIPVAGVLFRRRANETKKRELLIFVTPIIVEERAVL